MTGKKAKKPGGRNTKTEAPSAPMMDDNLPADEDSGAGEASSIPVMDGTPADAAEPIDPLAAMTAECDHYRDKWLRAVAEQENLRKRTRREVLDAHTFTRLEIVRGLLEVLDNFDRAEASLPEDAASHAEFAGFLGGVQLVHDRLRAILESHGLQKLAAEKGGEFDPGLHEAVAQIDDPGTETGAIVAVAQPGYRLGEIVVRPARVMVAK